MIGKTAKVIASWWTTALLIVTLIACYAFFTFGDTPYEKWARFLSFSPAGIILSSCLILNLLAASIRSALRKLQKKPVAEEDIFAMDDFGEIPSGNNQALMTEWIKKKRFRILSTDEGIRGVKGSFSFLPGVLFRIGVIVFISALLVSVHIRRSEKSILHEGEEKTIFGSRIKAVSISAVLPDDFLQVGEKSIFSLDAVSAVLSGGKREYRVTPGYPSKAANVWLRITDFGLSQPLSVRTAGKELDRVLDLEVLPPGKTGIVPLPGAGLLLTFSLHPERMITQGLLTGKSYDLTRPAYKVVVQKDKGEKAGEFVLSPENKSTLNGTTFFAGKNSVYVKIEAVRDPALPWIYAGLVLSILGVLCMFSRFFWYEKEIAALVRGDKLLIGYREEFYRKWGVQKFRTWMNELVK